MAAALFAAVPSYAVTFAVTSPWVGVAATFIAGNAADVHMLAVWNGSGGVSAVGRPRAGEVTIAVDLQDAARFRLSKKTKNLRLIYDKMPMTEEQLRRAFFDPAMLPFLAQSVMKIMAAADKKNYAFYQRRLAEFQSRIDSTLDIGQYLASSKTKMLDLTGAEGAWVRSAIPDCVRPPESVWNSWIAGDRAALRAALDEAARRKWLVLLDPWTPYQISSAASAYKNRLTLPAPTSQKDYFIFLHDIFTSIQKRLASMSK